MSPRPGEWAQDQNWWGASPALPQTEFCCPDTDTGHSRKAFQELRQISGTSGSLPRSSRGEVRENHCWSVEDQRAFLGREVQAGIEEHLQFYAAT